MPAKSLYRDAGRRGRRSSRRGRSSAGRSSASSAPTTRWFRGATARSASRGPLERRGSELRQRHFINERRIQRDPLSHGDAIRCGSLQVRFVEVPDSGAGMVRPSIPKPQPPASCRKSLPAIDPAARSPNSRSWARIVAAGGPAHDPKERCRTTPSAAKLAAGGPGPGGPGLKIRRFKSSALGWRPPPTPPPESKSERDQAVAA